MIIRRVAGWQEKRRLRGELANGTPVPNQPPHVLLLEERQQILTAARHGDLPTCRTEY